MCAVRSGVIVLECVAVCGDVLPCVTVCCAVCCSDVAVCTLITTGREIRVRYAVCLAVLECVAVCGNVLQCVTVCCALCCSVLQCRRSVHIYYYRGGHMCAVRRRLFTTETP